MKNSNKATGIIFLILGMLCIVFPIASSLWIELIIGASFIAGAFLSLFKIASGDGFTGKLYWLALSVLYAIGGVFILLNPLWGVMAVMLALGAIFLVEGVVSLIYWSDRRDSIQYPGLVLLNGFITLILGILVISNLNIGLWFIGFLVGIDFIFTGISMLAIGRAPTLAQQV